MKKNLVYLGVFCSAFFACEEVGPTIILEEAQVPLVDTSYVSTTPVTAVPKNILFEEFSGVRCSNCPAGNAETHNLVQTYLNRVIPVTIHSNFLAAPYDDEEDLRNGDANDIANNLGPVTSKPSCFIDRKIINGQRLINNPSSWSGLVAAELTQNSNVELQLEIVDFDVTERTMRYRSTLSFAQTLNDINLGFYITESEIFTTQLDLTVKVANYEHEYVLRKSLTSYLGNPITEDIQPNTIIIKEFEIDLDNFDEDKIWDINHMHVVAFLRQANETIVQAAMANVQ